MSDSSGRVADATGNWVDGLAPPFSRPYLRLSRFDRPIGSWLLLLPCWWSVGLAGMREGHFPNAWHIVLFFIGSFAMRGAGCTWNDLVDRDLDGLVERTRSRPIPSKQVTVAQATMFMLAQALVGFLVLVQFNRFTVLTGLASLLVVVTYPFMKRITYWPQIFLGLAFSWGALMGWPAEFARLDWPALVLYAGSICWVIGYDTIYAHQDRKDDLLIGIKSTALLFGERTPSMLAVFYTCAVVLIAAAGFMAGGGVVFALGLIAFAGHLAWQVTRLDIHDPAHCLKLFKSNRDAGFILFGAMLSMRWSNERALARTQGDRTCYGCCASDRRLCIDQNIVEAISPGWLSANGSSACWCGPRQYGQSTLTARIGSPRLRRRDFAGHGLRPTRAVATGTAHQIDVDVIVVSSVVTGCQHG
jgi:4-hydroxybenzoate polyprenyltransferase